METIIPSFLSTSEAVGAGRSVLALLVIIIALQGTEAKLDRGIFHSLLRTLKKAFAFARGSVLQNDLDDKIPTLRIRIARVNLAAYDEGQVRIKLLLKYEKVLVLQIPRQVIRNRQIHFSR
jgi:hypothetical protein